MSYEIITLADKERLVLVEERDQFGNPTVVSILSDQELLTLHLLEVAQCYVG